ncbi:MAG: tetratricopeptide repeat protein [Chitinophagaceae bacterium]
MRTKHYISIAIALAALVAVFLYVPTTPPKGAKGMGAASQHNDAAGQVANAEPASIDSIIKASKALLPPHALTELAAIESQIAQQKDSAQMASLFEKSAELWMEHKQGPMVAWNKGMAAHLALSEKKLTFAGQLYLGLMHDASTASMAAWEAGEAVKYLNEALALNPNNDTTKLALATAYIEGTGAPMAGVSILREMITKNPDNIPANLLLGRLSIQSGQYDKAVERLEHVLTLDPKNREALYFLGEAQKGKGENDKAIATFRKLEGIVNNPDFTKDLEEYISSFK